MKTESRYDSYKGVSSEEMEALVRRGRALREEAIAESLAAGLRAVKNAVVRALRKASDATSRDDAGMASHRGHA
jgi:hypothetical protein